MERRIDPEIQENVDRGEEDEQGSAGIDAEPNNRNDNEEHLSDSIENANAAGLGAIGRSDEKQEKSIPNQPAGE